MYRQHSPEQVHQDVQDVAGALAPNMPTTLAGFHGLHGIQGVHHHIAPGYTGHPSHPHYQMHHHNAPAPGYHHGPPAPHMNQGHIHPWYQAQMQAPSNPYSMQDEQMSVWHAGMFQSEYTELLWHNSFPPGMSHQQFEQNINRLPTPNSTPTTSEHSGAELENVSAGTSPNCSTGNPGAHGVLCQGVTPRTTRPSAARSPYSWIHKSTYQTQPNPGKFSFKSTLNMITSNQL